MNIRICLFFSFLIPPCMYNNTSWSVCQQKKIEPVSRLYYF
nr:MAG TPA: hypothetical protein [Caudoviricetes sp.]